MSYQAGRPENVLRRAEDLIAIDQPDVALQKLYNFIISKRAKHIDPTTPQLLDIFKLFIKLAINKRFTKDIKDALYQYKKMIQGLTSSIGYENLENLTKFLLQTANLKLNDAQLEANDAAEIAIEKSIASAAAASKLVYSRVDDDEDDDEDKDINDNVDIDESDDEDAINFEISPENILLSSVTTDDSVERSNKEFFLPWLKFVWECYRTVLELLRNNSKLETSYCQVSLQAFQFCIKYDRKSEFKRLCELLKTHLLSINKGDYYEDSINLSKPDTLQKFLDVRFQQLNTAVKLELWKESFKSIEDVHGLMKYSKRSPKPVALINYYNNLAKIFQVSNDYAYASAARQKIFQLLIKSPIITDDELKDNATIYLLTLLSIPILDSFKNSFSTQTGLTDAEFYKRKNNKLSNLLNLNQTPTRDSLLNSNVLNIVLKYADEDIVKLYNLIEKSFNPLTFHSNVENILVKISNNDKFTSFIQPLKEVFITKIISKISTLYDSIKFDFFHKLSSYNTEIFNYNEFEFEDLLVSGEYSNLIKCEVEIDDEAGVVNFNDKIYSSSTTSSINSRLYDLQKALTTAVNIINFDQIKLAKEQLNEKLIKNANETFEVEKQNILHTAELIKQREIELATLKKEEAAQLEKQKAEELLKQKRNEEERIKQEAEKHEKERIEKTRKEIDLANKKNIVKDINSRGVIQIKFDDVKNMTEDEIRQYSYQKLEEQTQKLEEQSNAIFKRMDYIERAERVYEIPILKKEIDEDVNKQLEQYNLLKEKHIEQSKISHEKLLQVKERLSRFVPAFTEYNEQLKKLGEEEIEAKKRKAKELFEAEKQARIEEFIAKKKQEYYDNIKKQEAEAKAKKEAEEREIAAAKAREEAERIRAEAAKAREEAAKARAEAAKASDPRKLEYEKLKNKEKLTFSEKIRLKVLAKELGL